MVQMKNELSDTNNLLQKQIEEVNDKSIEESKNMEQLNNNLQQQINIANYHSPVVFYCNDSGRYQYYGDKPCTHGLQHMLSEHQMKLFLATNISMSITNHNRGGPSPYHKHTIFIPQKKTVMLFKEGNVHQGIRPSIEIYSSGIHNNIDGCQFFWCGKEDDRDDFINTLKNVGYNCDNIIKY